MSARREQSSSHPNLQNPAVEYSVADSADRNSVPGRKPPRAREDESAARLHRTPRGVSPKRTFRLRGVSTWLLSACIFRVRPPWPPDGRDKLSSSWPCGAPNIRGEQITRGVPVQVGPCASRWIVSPTANARWHSPVRYTTLHAIREMQFSKNCRFESHCRICPTPLAKAAQFRADAAARRSNPR